MVIFSRQVFQQNIIFLVCIICLLIFLCIDIFPNPYICQISLRSFADTAWTSRKERFFRNLFQFSLFNSRIFCLLWLLDVVCRKNKWRRFSNFATLFLFILILVQHHWSLTLKLGLKTQILTSLLNLGHRIHYLTLANVFLKFGAYFRVRTQGIIGVVFVGRWNLEFVNRSHYSTKIKQRIYVVELRLNGWNNQFLFKILWIRYLNFIALFDFRKWIRGYKGSQRSVKHFWINFLLYILPFNFLISLSAAIFKIYGSFVGRHLVVWNWRLQNWRSFYLRHCVKTLLIYLILHFHWSFLWTLHYWEAQIWSRTKHFMEFLLGSHFS